MKYTYKNITKLQLRDWPYEEKERRNAVFSKKARVRLCLSCIKRKLLRAAKGKDNQAKLILAGNLLCQEKLIKAKRLMGKQENYTFYSCFRYIKPILNRSDLAIANLETVIHPEAPYASERYRIGQYCNHNAPRQFLDALRDAGFRLLTTANNHMLDTGMRGLYRTNKYLDTYGFLHTGSVTDTGEPRYVLTKVNDIRTGVLSYTTAINFDAAEMLTEEGRRMLNYYDPSRVGDDVAALRQAGADFIICYIHWGEEMTDTVTDSQRLIAQELADLGVDYIAGSHPHVIQPYEVLTAADGRRVPVAYSMGNLISHFQKAGPKTSIMLELDLTKRPDGTVSFEDHYIVCYTFDAFDKYKYVTVPLVNRTFRSERVNIRMQERRRRAARTLGPAISPSRSFDLREEELVSERPCTLREAMLNGTCLLPEPTPKQSRMLNAYRITEEFREDYCERMRQCGASDSSVQAALRAAKNFTGIKDLSVEKDWDLLGDMVYAKNVLGFFYWEYFVYGLRGKTVEEKMEFIPQKSRELYLSKLNTNREEIAVLKDKYLCYQRFEKYYEREIIKISGEKDEALFSEFCARHPRFLTKPLDDSCGNGIRIIDMQKSGKPSELFHELLTAYVTDGKTSCLCEELINAHPSFAAIHPESVNSLRVFTYFDDDEARVIVAWLKAGRGGAVVDNGSAGGLVAAIDIQTGTVTTPARNEANETFERHPDTGFPFVGFRIENWDEAVRTVKEAATLLDGIHVVAWDIALSADKGWQIIEGNTWGMFNLLQVATQKGMHRQFLKDVEWPLYKDS